MFNNIVEDKIKYYDNLMFVTPNSSLLNKVMLIMKNILTYDSTNNKTYNLQKKVNIDTRA